MSSVVASVAKLTQVYPRCLSGATYRCLQMAIPPFRVPRFTPDARGHLEDSEVKEQSRAVVPQETAPERSSVCRCDRDHREVSRAGVLIYSHPTISSDGDNTPQLVGCAKQGIPVLQTESERWSSRAAARNLIMPNPTSHTVTQFA